MMPTMTSRRLRRSPRAVLGFLLAAVLAGGTLAATPLSARAEGPDDESFIPSMLEQNGPLVATDALGRGLPLPGEAPVRTDERTVGVFYVLWHGTNDHRDYKKVYDNTATLLADPDAASDPASGAWPGPGHFAYWGEPLYGFYRSDDEWVMRRHLELLSEADVDYLLLDTSNNELYKSQAALLMRLIVELQAQGVKAPQVAFMTHTESTGKMDELYRTFYADDAPYRYPSTWFQFKGKPLILGEDPSDSVRDFFTYRHAQWPNEPADATGGWDWISFDRPQRANRNSDGSVEQMAVSTAQNSGSSSIFSYTALEQIDAVPSRSKNWHDGAEDESPGAVEHGHNAQEEWDHAIAQDPETILVLEWNEWIAGNWAARASDTPVFYDVVDTRWNRDMEMMRGGFGDNYYLQLVDNIRRYKGVTPNVPVHAETTIDLDGPATQWDAVAPTYRDYAGDTAHRNHAGTDTRTYVNTTGRNDIVETQVAYDDEHLYFRVQTADPLTPWTDEGWMNLYLDTDGDGTNGWLGYDFALNRARTSSSATTLHRAGADGSWSTVADDIPYRVDGAELVVSVPRAAIDASGPPRVEFKWWDNATTTGDPADLYLSGDVAPSSRFNYLFDARVTAQGPSIADVPVVDAPEAPGDGYHRIEDGAQTESKAFAGPHASDWIEVADAAASGGSTSYLINPQARSDRHYRNYVRAAFDGTSVRWVADVGPDGAQAEVFIDGLSQGVVSQYASRHQDQQIVFEKYGLPQGRHEVFVVWLTQSGRYTHDYFEYGVGDVAVPAVAEGTNAALTSWTASSSFDASIGFATNVGQLADGDPNTYWKASSSIAEWAELRLGRRTAIDRIVLEPRAGAALSSVTVQVWEGGGWSTVHAAASVTETASIGIPAVTTDRLRVLASGVAGPVEIAEFAAYAVGTPPASAPSTNWEFTTGSEGWTGEGLPGLSWDAGVLASASSDADARFVSPHDLALDAEEYGTLKFRIGNGTASTGGSVQFRGEGESFSATRSVPFRLTADPLLGYTEYAVDLRSHPLWSGEIAQLAIVLGNDATAGRSAIDFVRLARDNGVVAWHFDDDTEGWAAESGAPLEWNMSGYAEGAPTGQWDLLSPAGLRADARNHSVLKLSIRNDGSFPTARVFFATEAQPTFSGSRSAAVDLVARDDEFLHYEVDLASVAGWGGVLDRLRIRFEGGDGAVALDAIRLEPFVITRLGTKTSWEFATDAEGWGSAGNISGFGWSDGEVGGTIAGNDPQIYSPDRLWLDITSLTSVNIRLQVDSASTAGTFYFTTETSPSFSQDKSVAIPLDPANDGFAEVTLDMSHVSLWRGLLKQIRFDPAEGGGGTGSFRLDHVRLQSFTIAPLAITTTVGQPPLLPPTATLRYANGTTADLPVAWEAVPASSIAVPGSFSVRGTVEGGHAVTATVTVLAADTAWEFTSSLEGWGLGLFGIEALAWHEGGYLRGTNVWYGDAQFFSPDNLGMTITGRPLVRIGLQNMSAATRGTFFFSTTTSSGMSADKSVSIPLVPNDTGLREYVLDLSANEHWTGTLRQIRFDPTEDVSSGDFLLDYIRIRPASGGIPALAASTIVGAAPSLPSTVREEFTDGTHVDHVITWSPVPAEQYAAAGQFSVDGSLADGRTVAVVVSVRAPVVGWEFTDSAEGWGEPFGIGALTWDEGGRLRGTDIWYGDAQFFSPDDIGTDVANLSLVKVGLQNSSAATRGTFFFTTDTDPHFTAGKSITIPLHPNDAQVREYVLDLSAVVAWTGALKQIRFDPTEDVTAGGFLLDYVRLAPAPTGLDAVAITTVAGTPPALPGVVVERYEDGSSAEIAVIWETPPESAYTQPGSFQVVGALADARVVSATVTVSPRPVVPTGPDSPAESPTAPAATAPPRAAGALSVSTGSPSILPPESFPSDLDASDLDASEPRTEEPTTIDHGEEEVDSGDGASSTDVAAGGEGAPSGAWWALGILFGVFLLAGAGAIAMSRRRA